MKSMVKIIEVYCTTDERKWKISDEIVTAMVGMFLQQLN